MRAATPSTDQLIVLLAVADAGSFAGAARRLGRATSVISYSIAMLEGQLGVSLFDREATRPPRLSEAGRAIVVEARAVADGLAALRARAQGLLEDLESQVTVAVDEMFPAEALAAAFGDFRAQFPAVSVRLMTETLGGVEHLIRSGAASIGLGGVLHMNATGLQCLQIGSVRIIPVAAPHHPLARGAPARCGREHLQIVLTSRVGDDARSAGVVSHFTWLADRLSKKADLLRAGIGWGGMPEPFVRADLESGALVKLHLDDWRGGEYDFQLAHKTDMPPGRAGRWLIERIAVNAPSGSTSPRPRA